MEAIVSLLPEHYYQQVEHLWVELEQTFGVHGVYDTPYPHFSYHVARHYDIEKVAPLLERITANITRFQVHAGGIGIFTGASPVVYIPVARNLELSQLHEELWNQLSSVSSGIQDYYSPAQWMPHITVGFRDITRENLPAIVQWLNERNFTWEFTAENLAIIHDTGTKQELHSRYVMSNEPVSSERMI